MDWGGFAVVFICAIPVVAIICDATKECFRIKYGKEKSDKDEKIQV